jgi:hypothetical protein
MYFPGYGMLLCGDGGPRAVSLEMVQHYAHVADVDPGNRTATLAQPIIRGSETPPPF